MRNSTGEKQIKSTLPKFRSEQEESEYWDSHSPLDIDEKPKLEKVKVAKVKDSPITIRLDSVSREKLSKMASERGIGPSTLARLALSTMIDGREESKPDSETITVPKMSIAAEANKIGEDTNIYYLKGELNRALQLAIDGDWASAIKICDSVRSEDEEHHDTLTHGVEMVWLCIQQVNIKPLIENANKSLIELEYDVTCDVLDGIVKVCEASRMSLNYELLADVLRITQSVCRAARDWRRNIDYKLNRIMAKTVINTMVLNESKDGKMEELLQKINPPISNIPSRIKQFDMRE